MPEPTPTSFAFAIFCALGLTSVTAQSPAYHATTCATSDPTIATVTSDTVLAIPGLFDDFEAAGGGQFVELNDGTARLTVRVRSRSSLFSAFLVDLAFAGRIAPGQANHPPAGSPTSGLQPAAYVPSGSIDPATFVYYTQLTGRLYGTNAYDGAILDVQLQGPAVQLGFGANDRNDNFGLTANLQLTLVQPPTGPFVAPSAATLTCDLPTTVTDRASHPQIDPTRTNLAFGRALDLPGVGNDYVFVPAGEFEERADGTAELRGRLCRASQLDDAWDLTLTGSNRIDPGEAMHPPTGSPVLGMLPSAYAGNGGVIDPAGWRYYGTVTGTLSGVLANAGGQLDLTNTGALQIGGGANQTNAFHGGYGTFQVSVSSQPTSRTVSPTGTAELYVLAARQPVLPLPILTSPSMPYALPTLTDQGIVLQGDNMAWVELVAVGPHLAGRGEPRDFLTGWFEILDNQHLRLHPRPGLAPAVYDLRTLNAAVASNLEHITLAEPTAPTLVAEPTAGPGELVHLHLHDGQPSGPVIGALAASFSPLPTVFPGLVTLDIGNQGSRLSLIPVVLQPDPTTGIARLDAGPYPAGFSGLSLLYQAVVIDAVNFTTPLPKSNVWSVGL
ncbi:MAG: hypothetical protein NXI31_26715 [bacterium]|nr:hypothetical protein [bacterium]